MNNFAMMMLSSPQTVGEKNNLPICSLHKTLKSCLSVYVNTCLVTSFLWQLVRCFQRKPIQELM